MLFLRLMFLISFTVSVAALATSVSDDLLLLSLPCAIASLVLILQALWRQRRKPKPKPWVVVDGSNVMHWKDDTPSIQTVREVVDELAARGFAPGVVFDANAGYKIAGRYLNERALARLLKLPFDRVHVVPKGEPADPFILRAANGLDGRVVTNDRYRDWIDAYPEIRRPGFLIKGRYDGGVLKLADTTEELTASAG